MYKCMVLLVCWAGVCLAEYHDDDGYGGGYEDSREYGYEKEQYKSEYSFYSTNWLCCCTIVYGV